MKHNGIPLTTGQAQRYNRMQRIGNSEIALPEDREMVLLVARHHRHLRPETDVGPAGIPGQEQLIRIQPPDHHQAAAPDA